MPLGPRSSSENSCPRVLRQKPRPGTTGELCSQPPDGVAEIMLPWRSITSKGQGGGGPAAAGAPPRAPPPPPAAGPPPPPPPHPPPPLPLPPSRQEHTPNP